MGVENPCVRKTWICDLTVAAKGTNKMLIHLATATLNREAEGLGVVGGVTVSPSPQSKDEENEKLHKLREYARDFRRQHMTDAEQFDWDSDDGDYGLAIGRLVVT
jgi:hypothetical protein